MTTSIESVHLGSVVVIKSHAIEDDRGFFMETFKANEFRELGLPHEFVQDNHSGSKRGVVRGLHFSVGAGDREVDARDAGQRVSSRR